MELFKIEFNYELLDIVDQILADKEITIKRFDSIVTYFVKLDMDKDEKILNYLIMVSHQQIKITHLHEDEEPYEVGTDKPLGSKAAIDEN